MSPLKPISRGHVARLVGGHFVLIEINFMAQGMLMVRVLFSPSPPLFYVLPCIL